MAASFVFKKRKQLPELRTRAVSHSIFKTKTRFHQNCIIWLLEEDSSGKIKRLFIKE